MNVPRKSDPTPRAAGRVLAVVLNYNGGEDVLVCLRTLAAQTYPALDVLVIDNASTDGSREAVAAEFPDVDLLANDRNLGYCRANNQGLERVVERGYHAGLLLNDDVVLEPDTVAVLAESLARDPSVGVVGPKVLFEPERHRIWCAGGRLDYRQNLNRLRGHGRPAGSFDRAEAVDYVPGCALLIRRETLERTGPLDERYFAYLEDVELCLRVRQAGFQVRYEPRAQIYHRVSRASGDRYSGLRKYLNARNSVHFLRQHGSWRAWLGFLVFDVATLPPAWIAQALRGRGAAVRAKALGLWRGFRGETGRPPWLG